MQTVLWEFRILLIAQPHCMLALYREAQRCKLSSLMATDRLAVESTRTTSYPSEACKIGSILREGVNSG